MDQRRLFLFLTLCFLLMIVFGPKPKPPQNPDGDDAAQVAEVEGQENAGDGEAAASSTADDKSPAEGEGQPVEIEAVEVGQEYVTLGSVDPDSPYRLGVTLTNQGASVRRAELSNPRFRDLQDRGGYIGHLELAVDERGGLRIQSLVPGTPAAKAGLKIGDRMVSYTDEQGGQTPFTSADELSDLLKQRKPKKELTLQIAKGDQQPADQVITLTRRPLEVIRPEIENVAMRTDQLPEDLESPPSFQFTLEQLGTAKIPESAEEIVGIALRDSNWEITERDEQHVSFRKGLPKHGLEVYKHYRLEPVPTESQEDNNFPGYSLTLDIEIRNLGEKAQSLRYQLDGPNGLPMEGWWYAHKISRNWGASGIRDVIARDLNDDGLTHQFAPVDIAKDDIEDLRISPLAYVGVDAQYFSAMLIPNKPSLETHWIDELRTLSLSPEPKGRSAEGRYANVTCRLISQEQQIAPGEKLSHSYEIFAGPKRPDLLVNYQACKSTQYSLSNLMYYGWFSGVSKGMLAILHLFYGMIGNYGIAIIMLTVLVRGLMFPISRKQAQSMAKMQELRPEMEKIKEKYKQDMQKQSQATQELYRKHKINPLAGCLPMFIQLPIFLGLYRALMVDVELRQAPLLGDAIRWCSNLAAPDMFFDWSAFMPQFINNGEGIFGLGPYLNILPLITIALFILQQKMFMPEPTNEQAAMQQKIMKFMMIFMGFLFFKVAAGLCIYFIASSIWGIAERKMLPKPAATPGLATAGAPPSTSISPHSNGADKSTRRRNNQRSKKKKR